MLITVNTKVHEAPGLPKEKRALHKKSLQYFTGFLPSISVDENATIASANLLEAVSANAPADVKAALTILRVVKNGKALDVTKTFKEVDLKDKSGIVLEVMVN